MHAMARAMLLFLVSSRKEDTMKDKTLARMVLVMLLAAPAAAMAREAPPVDVRNDSRAPISERMQMNAEEEFSCSTGHPAGWLAAVAAVGLVALRRRPRR
jgi:MYXO-CTERM domain-containing protein